MSRTQRSHPSDVQGICRRLIAVLQNDFQMTLGAMAFAMDYSNQSTVTRINQGSVLPDPVRLATLASRLAKGHGRTVNLHWVYTGRGTAIIDECTQGAATTFVPNYEFIKLSASMTATQKEALVALLSPAVARHGGRKPATLGRRRRRG
jgi:hypothetical protein